MMKEIIYSKFSNERDRKFAIRTDILEENGKRLVKKAALYPEGKAHEADILRWYQELKELYSIIPYEANVCKKEEEGICLEYIEGKTLEELLDEKILSGNVQEAEQILEEYLHNVERIYSQNEFVITDKFTEVFGQVSFEENHFCASVTNIDMVCGNLVLTEVPVVLDYEWTFDFPVPAKFVLYRIIHYYIETHASRACLDEAVLFEKFGISSICQEKFAVMEQNFQKYITGKHVPMRNMYAKMTPGVSGSQDSFKYLQIFFSENDIYSEKKSIKLSANDGIASYTVPIPKGCQMIRLDPGDGPCIIRVDRLSFNGTPVDISDAKISEGCISGEWIYIAKNDPNISDIVVPGEASEMDISIQIYSGNEEMIRGMVKQNRLLNEKITWQEALIKEMEGTKVWKLYQKYRQWVERKS